MRPSNIPPTFQKSTSRQFQIFYSMILANIPFCNTTQHSTMWLTYWHAICCWTVHSLTPLNVPFNDTYLHFILWCLPTHTKHSMIWQVQHSIPWDLWSSQSLTQPKIPSHENAKLFILRHTPTFNSVTLPNIPFPDTCKHFNPRYASIPSVFQHPNEIEIKEIKSIL